MSTSILEIAVPTPLRRCFDYLASPLAEGLLLPDRADEQQNNILPGTLVRIRFAKQELTGVVLRVKQQSEYPLSKLKPIESVISAEPCLSPELITLIQWAANYYQCPIGEAFATALPILLRQGQPEVATKTLLFRLSTLGKGLPKGALKRAKQQANLLQLFQTHTSLSKTDIYAEGFNATHLKSLTDKGLIETFEQSLVPAETHLLRQTPLPLTNEQAVALAQIEPNQFQIYLLDGITGSGKTEVYLQAIEKVLRCNQQVLVLVPEIGLTPQTVHRFQARFSQPICCLHSGLNDRERLDAWISAKQAKVKIVIGTRSSIFTPMPHLGMIIIDEEHDASFKQQDGFHYSARDLATIRAKNLNIPLILGSATPALETYQNAISGRFQHLRLTERAGQATPPHIELLDIRAKTLTEGFAQETLHAIALEISKKNQVLVFLNRRGFSPSLECHHCGWLAECSNCSVRLTLHLSQKLLRCHHCDQQSRIPKACPNCNGRQLNPVGQGTERSELALTEWFPQVPVIRVDRDSTRNKSAMNDVLNRIHEGDACILVGTQMLAKGHHFPKVTLVVVLDADTGLFSADFRGPEKMGQLLLQVAGRAGRADLPGRVIVQSHHTDHPLLQTLFFKGYPNFSEELLRERQLTNMPPFGHIVLIRAEAKHGELAAEFLHQCKNTLLQLQNYDSDWRIIGPLPCPLERRGDRYRWQIQLIDQHRRRLHSLLTQLIDQLEGLAISKRVRWSVDVDPIDMN